MPSAVYNEIDPYACNWLVNLVNAGHIANGVVSDESIETLTPDSVEDSAQFHAFAGIGVWSYALRLAGWPDDRPAWTGSCPCQPFSVAGKGRGINDKRHLWPEWLRLIRELAPPTIFGEQVASPAGRSWLATVQTDLEALGYRFAAADLCAAGVGAPHLRQRLFWVADAKGFGIDGTGCNERKAKSARYKSVKKPNSHCVEMSSAMADTERGATKRHGHEMARAESSMQGETWKQRLRSNPWDGGSVDWLPCSDGKARPVEPGVKPLAHGITNRMGQLRAYGNAIVPQVAATFVRAYMESVNA